MNEKQKIENELAWVSRVSTRITIGVWVVAAVVMLYGIPIVYKLLTGHDVPAEIAWMLSPAVDAALTVALLATPVLARYDIKSGWIGALRWVAGFTTWALNTAEPWTKAGGPDVLGVFTHSVGPVLLFVVVEGASYFQRKMGHVINDLKAKLAALDYDHQAERDHLNNLTAQVRQLSADLTDIRQREAQLTAERADLKTTLDATALELATVRTALNEAEERAAVHLNETVTALKVAHTEEMARLRAEAATVDLNGYRSARNKTGADRNGGSTKTGGRSLISDEEALQKLLADNSDPDYVWSQAAVRRVTGVGFERAKDLIAALKEHHEAVAALRSDRATVTPSEGRGSPRTDDAHDRAVEPSSTSIGA